MFRIKSKNTIILIIFICSICTFFCGIKPVEAIVNSQCLFCDTDAEKIKKERQFATKIKIIKSVFGDTINAPVLAATVLYVNMDNSVNNYYEENFNENDFRSYYTNLKSGLDTGTDLIAKTEADGHKDITNSDIDLLTAATILMYFSTLEDCGLSCLGDPYNEEKYKKVLLLDKGFTTNAIVDTLLCSGASQTIFSFITLILDAFKWLNPFSDYSVNDTLNYLTNMHNICDVGFLEATYHRVEAAETDAVEEARKQQVINHIFQLAEIYEEWLGGSGSGSGYGGGTCIVNGASGDYSSWKQCDSQWGSNALGSSTICQIGCLATSISIQMARSGTTTTLPSGYSSFTPGAFVKSISENGGLSGNNIAWQWSTLAPNFSAGRFVTFTDENSLAAEITKVLSEKEQGKYQRYVVLQISKPTQHWVAVEGVENGEVIINDPAKSGKTLDENYSSWQINGYRIMWATDSSTNSTASSVCTTSSGSFADLLDFVAYVEGSSKCNNGNGYSAENLGDGAGMTTAFGITENYSAAVAKEVGYTNFLSDIRSGCTDKTYIDQMFPIIMEKYVTFVTKKNQQQNLGLTQNQIYVLSSVAYNTGTAGSVVDIIDTIKENGINDFETFNCMKTKGCAWTASGFNDGLVRRRMAEHEVLVTGNFGAAKPTETYSYFQSINTNAKFEEYKSSHWPTQR